MGRLGSSGVRRRGTGGLRATGGGFTLTELLVVLGILTLQAAMLLPVASRTRAAVRGVYCLTSLRQWGVGTHLYAADHDDCLPPEGAPNPTERSTNIGWYIQLPRQLGQTPYHHLAWRTNPLAPTGTTLWLCPANPRRSNGRNLFHYCLNQDVDGTGDRDAPVRLASVREPARLVWLFDSKNLPAVGPGNYAATNLHGDGAQFLFLDGHSARRAGAAYRFRPTSGVAADNGEGTVLWEP